MNLLNFHFDFERPHKVVHVGIKTTLLNHGSLSLVPVTVNLIVLNLGRRQHKNCLR